MINHLPLQKNQQIQLAAADASANWQTQMANTITDLDELLATLHLSHHRSEFYTPTHFKLNVPRAFVGKMQKGNISDPLLKQILPNLSEGKQVTGFVADPLEETAQNPNTGLLHKYHSRVLLTLTGACAVHCRYCFRQHFDYRANLPKSSDMDRICRYITEHPKINEVILSGGDPLSLSNRRLFGWLDALAALPQVKVIRLHTRLPVVIPERLQPKLLEHLAQLHCQVVMVIHANHPNEIDNHTASYLKQLQAHRITALNQTVLLQAVNDHVDTLAQLSWRLFESGVLPYYLHVLDKVAGASHFMVTKSVAVDLYWRLLEVLPGYLMPKLVQELPHKPFKTPVNLF